MSECLITVVMALYKPNKKWLAEELESINNQTYKDFKLFAWNDCPNDTYNYNEFFDKYLPDIEFKIYNGDKNLGSNLAFNELTKLVKTKYIAYSDQDDIWELNKLEELLKYIQTKNVSLVCSNMSVIDGESHLTAHRIEEVRPHQIFPKDHFFDYLLTRNFVTGCTVLADTDMAKSAIPFPAKYPYHDWWLAIAAECDQGIGIVRSSLMKYRIHGENQSGMLKGVVDKKTYFNHRVVSYNEFITSVSKLVKDKDQKKKIQRHINWNNSRISYFESVNPTTLFKYLKNYSVNPTTTAFEILLPYMPSFVFRFLINNIRKGKI